jgi:hypothetical protein
MPSKRIPINRRHRIRITDETLRLFLQAEAGNSEAEYALKYHHLRLRPWESSPCEWEEGPPPWWLARDGDGFGFGIAGARSSFAGNCSRPSRRAS